MSVISNHEIKMMSLLKIHLYLIHFYIYIYILDNNICKIYAHILFSDYIY